jgi:hypothetical protein
MATTEATRPALAAAIRAMQEIRSRNLPCRCGQRPIVVFRNVSGPGEARGLFRFCATNEDFDRQIARQRETRDAMRGRG